jgi:uncharacterized protein (TIGR00251 family)
MEGLRETRGGVLMNVRVRAGAGRNEITGERAGAIKISVSQPPEKGKANKALCRYVAKILGLRPSQVVVVSGARAREKVLMLRDAEIDETGRRLAEILEKQT